MENKEREFLFKREEINKGRKEHRSHHDEHHYRSSRKSHRSKIIETKLFVNKDELVEYVNTKGQSSNTIEIFKIEEGLYKLVIKE